MKMTVEQFFEMLNNKETPQEYRQRKNTQKKHLNELYEERDRLEFLLIAYAYGKITDCKTDILSEYEGVLNEINKYSISNY